MLTEIRTQMELYELPHRSFPIHLYPRLAVRALLTCQAEGGLIL